MTNGFASGLHGLQASLPFVFGAGLANPNDAAAHSTERFVVEYDLDDLAAAQMERAAKAKAFLGGVDHKAGKAFGAAGGSDDQAGARFGGCAFGATAPGVRQAGHGSPLGAGSARTTRNE